MAQDVVEFSGLLWHPPSHRWLLYPEAHPSIQGGTLMTKEVQVPTQVNYLLFNASLIWGSVETAKFSETTLS